MHEMSLVRNVVSIVLDEAEAAHAAEISKVYIVVGEGRDVVESLFEDLFRFLARGTVAQNAQVILERVPYMVKCNQCGTEYHFNVYDKQSWNCPECGAIRDYKLVTGMEFYISRIEAPRRLSPASKESAQP